MKDNFFPALRLTLFCAIFFSGIYTAAVWSVAQLAPNAGRGDIITQNGQTYYANIGQSFESDRYFWSRPSAAGYNAAASCGSNKGPTNPAYLAEVAACVDTFLAHHPGIARSAVPADLVTSSGSGLDPHISVAAARVQAKRVASVRQLAERDVELLVNQQIEAPLFGLFGPARVHVLRLNLALDQMQ